MSVTIKQRTAIIIDPGSVHTLYPSIPYYQELATPANVANRGIVRHGGLDQPRDHVPSGYKPAYEVHAQYYLDHIGDPNGTIPRELFIWGMRNSHQNLLFPVWDSRQMPKLLHRPDEPWSHTTYFALCQLPDGALTIAAVKYGGAPGQNDPDRATIVGKDPNADLQPVWAVPGQPVLLDGEVPPLPFLAAYTYDLRHIWHLLWERWQWEKWPEYQRHKTVHDELMAAFMDHLGDPAERRGEALVQIAAREALLETDAYLHSTLGLKEDGSIILLMMRGSLTDLGHAQRDMGAKNALLLDNGGSIGVGYYSKRSWAQGGWGNEGVKPTPVFIGNGTYFRPRGNAVFIAEMTEEFVEPPFTPRTW